MKNQNFKKSKKKMLSSRSEKRKKGKAILRKTFCSNLFDNT